MNIDHICKTHAQYRAALVYNREELGRCERAQDWAGYAKAVKALSFSQGQLDAFTQQIVNPSAA